MLKNPNFDLNEKVRIAITQGDFQLNDASELWKVFKAEAFPEFSLKGVTGVKGMSWFKTHSKNIDRSAEFPIQILKSQVPDEYDIFRPWLVVAMQPKAQVYWSQAENCNYFAARFTTYGSLLDWLARQVSLKGIPIRDTYQKG